MVGIIGLVGVTGLFAGRSTAEGDTPAVPRNRAAADTDVYAAALTRALERLGEARSAEVQRTRNAETRDAQASALTRLAKLHRRASKRIGRATAPTSLEAANESLIGALQRTATAYRDAARAAAAGRHVAYQTAQESIKRAEAQVRKRVSGLEGRSV